MRLCAGSPGEYFIQFTEGTISESTESDVKRTLCLQPISRIRKIRLDPNRHAHEFLCGRTPGLNTFYLLAAGRREQVPVFGQAPALAGLSEVITDCILPSHSRSSNRVFTVKKTGTPSRSRKPGEFAASTRFSPIQYSERCIVRPSEPFYTSLRRTWFRNRHQEILP